MSTTRNTWLKVEDEATGKDKKNKDLIKKNS